MRVAIMGAGLSGLACALTLEKHGIQPDIYEKRGIVGDRFIMAELMLNLLYSPVQDAVRYFSDSWQIYLKPESHLQTLYVHSPNHTAELTGHLGFINARGRHPHAYEKQLAEQLKSSIQFNSKKTYEELTTDYTHVVMATGDAAYTEKIQQFDLAFTVTLRGLLLKGDFEKTVAHAWFNHDFAPKGMGYLLPLSNTEAHLVLAYPEYHEHQLQQEELWTCFLKNATATLGCSLQSIDSFHVNHYMIGKGQTPRIGNTFFTGNCFGALMPFLGFGQFEAMMTGIYAGLDLIGAGKYEELTKGLTKSYNDSLVLRRALEGLSNEQLDKLVQLMGKHPIQNLLLNHNINVLTWMAKLIRLLP